MKNDSVPVCESTIIHQDIIKKVKKQMPKEDDLYALSELFRSFADGTRLEILFALSQEEMCVCDISALLGMSQSAISHQLRVLRNVRLVKHRKEGKTVYYSLDDDHVRSIFGQGLEHVSHTRKEGR